MLIVYIYLFMIGIRIIKNRKKNTNEFHKYRVFEYISNRWSVASKIESIFLNHFSLHKDPNPNNPAS